ncbi:MAG: hypothetical protein WA051_02795 [Minisyncoccia bacterium]
MPEIIPAILSNSFEDIEKKVKEISYSSPWVQIDVVDGIYAPSKTWPFLNTDDEDLKALIHEDKALPEWENVSYEFDLMVTNPRAVADTFVMAGASRIIVHYSSFKDDNEREVFLKDFKKRYNLPEPLGVELGLAIGTDIEIVDFVRYIEQNKLELDFVQLMGIDRIGKQGEKFNEKTIERVRELKKLIPDLVIQIDGGVGEEHIKPLIEAGAERLIEGGIIWSTDDPIGEYERLLDLTE